LQSSYSKATKAELGKDWNQAFQLYIKAAEGYLHLSRTTVDDRLRAHYKADAGKALKRAEKIKANRHDLKPVSVNPFSERKSIR